MHIKNRSYINNESYIKNNQDDVTDALYLSIKSHGLPYNKATLERVTPVKYTVGSVLLEQFLDYGTPNQKLLTRTEFLTASDDEVVVDRTHTMWVKGKSKVVGFIASV